MRLSTRKTWNKIKGKRITNIWGRMNHCILCLVTNITSSFCNNKFQKFLLNFSPNNILAIQENGSRLKLNEPKL